MRAGYSTGNKLSGKLVLGLGRRVGRGIKAAVPGRGSRGASFPGCRTALIVRTPGGPGKVAFSEAAGTSSDRPCRLRSGMRKLLAP